MSCIICLLFSYHLFFSALFHSSLTGPYSSIFPLSLVVSRPPHRHALPLFLPACPSWQLPDLSFSLFFILLPLIIMDSSSSPPLLSLSLVHPLFSTAVQPVVITLQMSASASYTKSIISYVWTVYAIVGQRDLKRHPCQRICVLYQQVLTSH